MRVKILQTTSSHKFPVVSKLIGLFQKTSYSHYALDFSDLLVLDATKEGVQLRGKECFLKNNTVINEYELPNEFDSEKVFKWAEEFDGRRYGFLQVFGIALMVLGLIKTNPFGKEQKAIICNELVLLFMQKFCGVDLYDTDDYDLNTTNKVICRYLHEQEFKKRLKEYAKENSK